MLLPKVLRPKAATTLEGIQVARAAKKHRPYGCARLLSGGLPSEVVAVDQELHELCSRSPNQDDYADVYVKVVIIGQVYAAGISRSSRADGDREAAVAQGIVRQAAEIDAALEALTSAQFNRATATRLIELHARTARGSNSTQASGGSSRSCRSTCISTAPSFPILDSRAETSIGGFVDWTSLYRIREAIGRPPNWLTSYYNFVTAFVALSERISLDAGASVSVKEIDHKLWRGKWQ